MIQFIRHAAILSLAGIAMVTSSSITTKAGVTTINEVDLAGINLDLNVYASDFSAAVNPYLQDTSKQEFRIPMVDSQSEQKSDTNKTKTANKDKSKNTKSAKKTEKEKETKKKKSTPVDKTIKLNLVYDRLGIAKVDNYLNIREEAGEDKEIIGKLPKNAGCHIYEIDDNGWARIVSGKVTGWVKAEYLITDEKAEEYAKEVATKVATIQTETLKVRFLPTTDAKVYDLVPEDESLDIVKENLTENFVTDFIKNHTEDEFDITEGIDKKSMMEALDNWVCIKIDDEKAFVSKEFVEIAYKLERAVKVEELKTDGSSGVSSTRASIVEYAKQFLGNPYVWGGTSLTNGADCSGFTMRLYEHYGYSIPRTSGAQSQYFTGINSSDAKPGDLFFYGSNGRVNHVAMYIGGGQVIHASTKRTGIKISNAFYRTPLKVGRIIKE